jgi:hypothetical protein
MTTINEQAELEEYDVEYDVRVELRKIFSEAQQIIKKEKTINIEAILIIGKLKDLNAGPNLNYFESQYIEALGLTPDQYYKRLAAYNAMKVEPALLKMLENGETHVSHLAIIGPRITEANSAVIVERLKGMSKRDVQFMMSGIDPDGQSVEVEPTIETRLKLNAAQLEILDRAKTVLSAQGKTPSLEEVVMMAMDDLLTKRDLYCKENGFLTIAGIYDYQDFTNGRNVPGELLRSRDR